MTQTKPTILFDLDGTLLPMNIQDFEDTYFKGLCMHLINDFKPEDVIKYIWGGTKAMMQNKGPQTNREVFADAFTKLSGMDFYANEERFMHFYRTDFQKCQDICQISNISKDIVNTLQEKGYTVAIATNPIFPEVATYSRLKWLGLDPEQFPLVTTYENCHSAKPNLEYYKEVCQTLNVKPEDCILFGNDVLEDGIATQLGMKVNLVTDHLLNPKNLPYDIFDKYSLKDVLTWAKELA